MIKFFGQAFLKAKYFADLFLHGSDEVTVEPTVEPQYGGGYAQARANHLRRMQQIDEQDVEDIAMIFSLFRSMSRG
jgi:hypothetical protein